MTDTDRYFRNVNCRTSILEDKSIIFIPIYMFGGFSIVGIFFYLIMIFKNSNRYLSSGKVTLNSNDGLNGLLILPFSREAIYKTHIKMMFVTTMEFIATGLLANILSYLFRNIHFLKATNSNPILTSMITRTGYYILTLCTLFILLNFLVKLINNYCLKFIRKIMLGMSLWLIISLMLNLAFAVNKEISVLSQYIYLGISIVLAIFSLIILIVNIKKNYEIFVTNFRGDETC